MDAHGVSEARELTVALSSGMPATTTRIHNFSAGPAVLPVRVLEQVQSELLDYRGTGMSVLEMSHRSAAFEDIVSRAEADLRALLGLTDDHAVLFLQGGASLQFAMVPMNLRPAGASADYVLTGHWSKAALKEAEKLGTGARGRRPPRPRSSIASPAPRRSRPTPRPPTCTSPRTTPSTGRSGSGSRSRRRACLSCATPPRTS